LFEIGLAEEGNHRELRAGEAEGRATAVKFANSGFALLPDLASRNEALLSKLAGPMEQAIEACE